MKRALERLVSLRRIEPVQCDWPGAAAAAVHNKGLRRGRAFMNYNVNPLAVKAWCGRSGWTMGASGSAMSMTMEQRMCWSIRQRNACAAFDQEKLAAALSEASKGAIKDDPASDDLRV